MSSARSVAKVRGRFSVNTASIDRKIAQLEEMEQIVQKYVDHAVVLAKSYARVDTGAMRDSIEAEVRQTAKSIVWEITVGKGLKDGRARANEYGTSGMSAQPMIRPAIEQIRGPMMAELRAVWRS